MLAAAKITADNSAEILILGKSLVGKIFEKDRMTIWSNTGR